MKNCKIEWHIKYKVIKHIENMENERITNVHPNIQQIFYNLLKKKFKIKVIYFFCLSENCELSSLSKYVGEASKCLSSLGEYLIVVVVSRLAPRRP